MSEPKMTSATNLKLALKWPREQPKALLSNQFAVSLGVPAGSGPDEIYLMIGHVDPPFLVGTPSDVENQAAQIQSLEVDVLGRYVFTRSRLSELISLLQGAADIYDRATGGTLDEDASEGP
ncbi:hypothetical protein ACIGFK_21325 [Streptomyces sp. NPDC085524]|uniref:hypothetical protein n=1 Tax=Streptomyces sp. NPDC085524 TaxID=3365728 RepID=UPI0037D8BD44